MPQPSRLRGLVDKAIDLAGKIPDSAIAALGRFSVAAIFWKSGQTKVEGFSIDLIERSFSIGLPHLSASAVDLFRDEYHLPLLDPALAATAAAFAEHFFPVLLLLGLGTRFAALALFGMTMVIEVFVYPDAYPTHGVWATVLLFLIARGGGVLSLDHLIARRASMSVVTR
ncbi:DoxX family protein [Niveibacterium umoris]|uniref:Putative oxidoreductase n=1 Tax=Niveibacterium umoris TaxID=1193620 RepID=A0A840BF71_9RHOO|nr:DoxX family protein [Niveibacterium umoris]MBB4011680.1 putative oxidoreductase [Niveibacterium umoris]